MRKSLVILLIFLGIYGDVLASKGFNRGQSFAKGLGKSLPKSANNIPGYAGTNVPESNLSHEQLSDAARMQYSKKGSVGEMLLKSARERPQFNFNPDDSALARADKIVNNPFAVLSAKQEIVVTKDKIVERFETCLAPAQDVEITALQTLSHVGLIEKKQTYLYTRHWARWAKSQTWDYKVYNTPNAVDSWHNAWDGPNQLWRAVRNYYDYYRRPIVYHIGEGIEEDASGTWAKTDQADFTKGVEAGTNSSDRWEGAENLESYVDRAVCHYIGAKCLEGEGTRLINGANVTRSCWKREITYGCSFAGVNTCKTLNLKGCSQVNSKCKQKVGNTCVLFEQTYLCRDIVKGTKVVRLKGSTPFCLAGDCSKTGYTANSDMAGVLSKLAILRQVSKDMDAKAGKVFAGTRHSCDKHCVNFTDCCASLKGWGISTGLSKCSEGEKVLAKLRATKKCVFIGTHCAEKVLSVCIRKKSVFCCFSSQLARLVQEQGRGQLGIDWGNSKRPQCRALAVSEFAKLDFEKIDLSELLADLMGQVSVPQGNKMLKAMHNDWQLRLPDEKQLTPKVVKGQIPGTKLLAKERGSVSF